MNKEQLLETAHLLLDSLYSHKEFIDTSLRKSLGEEKLNW